MTIVIGLLFLLITISAAGAFRMWLIEREALADEDADVSSILNFLDDRQP